MPEHSQQSGQTVTQAIQGFKSNFLQGLGYVRAVKGMFSTMLYVCSINFFLAPVMLLLPFYAEHHLEGGVQWYGYLLSAMAIGSIMGAIFGVKLSSKHPSRAACMQWTMALAGLSICALGLVDNCIDLRFVVQSRDADNI